jgi:hypothetical protein
LLAAGQSARRLARVVYELIKKEQPKNTIAGCLSGLSIIIRRIADLRDERNSWRGNMRFCSGGFLAERQEFMDKQGNLMIQLEDAGISIRSAVEKLWNGERNCAILLSFCATPLEKLVFRDILMHVEDKKGQFPVDLHVPCDEDVRKLRIAVLCLEEDSLDELEISAGACDAAIRANSATIYVVLKRESDFSKIEARLSSMLSSFEHCNQMLSIFRTLHYELSSCSLMKRDISSVLSDLSSSAVGLTQCELGTVTNVATLICPTEPKVRFCAA